MVARVLCQLWFQRDILGVRKAEERKGAFTYVSLNLQPTLKEQHTEDFL